LREDRKEVFTIKSGTGEGSPVRSLIGKRPEEAQVTFYL
jgi:hypothetical protein